VPRPTPGAWSSVEPRWLPVGLGCLVASWPDGVHLVVAFIPTKENVFAGRIRDFSQHALLQDLVADEEALKRTVIADMDALGVEHIDLLNALRASPAQPYDDSMNGHPNVAGHNAIAAEIARFLQARRDGERPAA